MEKGRSGGTSAGRSVWAVTVAQALLLALWKVLPQTRTATGLKLGVVAGALVVMGVAAYRGALPRTRPIVPGSRWLLTNSSGRV
jgi:hypothetical protein